MVITVDRGHRRLWLVTLTALSGMTTGALMLAITARLPLAIFIACYAVLCAALSIGIFLSSSSKKEFLTENELAVEDTLGLPPAEQDFVPAFFQAASFSRDVEKLSTPDRLCV